MVTRPSLDNEGSQATDKANTKERAELELQRNQSQSPDYPMPGGCSTSRLPIIEDEESPYCLCQFELSFLFPGT